jgi:hypothetical protein
LWADYWDGSGIKPLSDDVRQELSKIYKNWDRTNGYQCVAFAYKHVKPKYNYLFKRSGSPDPVSIRSRIRASSSGSKKKGKGKARGDEDEESDQSDEEVEQIDSPDTSANEDETTEERGMRHLKKIREHQIFIGAPFFDILFVEALPWRLILKQFSQAWLDFATSPKESCLHSLRR